MPGARVIHVDVMDGHFVPPISIGALIVDALRDLVHDRGGVLDVHLMVERPERRVEEFAAAGADTLIVHWEATPHVHYALQAVRDAGLDAGLALNPATPPEVVAGLADEVDHLLCMTVNPGWGGQPYIESSTAKVARLRELLGPDIPIEVDGGIDAATRRGHARGGGRRCSWPAPRSSARPTRPRPTGDRDRGAAPSSAGRPRAPGRFPSAAARDRPRARRVHGHVGVRVEVPPSVSAERPALRPGEDDASPARSVHSMRHLLAPPAVAAVFTSGSST